MTMFTITVKTANRKAIAVNTAMQHGQAVLGETTGW